MGSVCQLDAARSTPRSTARSWCTGGVRIRFNNYELDASLHELRHDGAPVTVEPQVFRVLTYLAEHGGRVVTKEELLDNVWGDRFVSESALTTRIKQARRAVGDDGSTQSVIKTIHGAGYRFVARIEQLDSTAGRRSGLPPAAVTPLIGRDDDVVAITELVRRHRLVTLTGVGGVGKTRLALEVARTLDTELSDGVRWVELAPVLDAGALPAALAGALDVATQSDQRDVDGIAAALSGRDVLLVLDNCEHLVDAVADLARTVLGGADTVTILTTSREVLGIEGEHVRAVAPLDTTADGRSAAVELFVQRAEAVGGYLADDDLEVIAEICRRLDGLALAIELAAARTLSMSPQQVCERLSDRFHILGSARSGVHRHQTLRQAVAWSYDLLDDDERALLQRCSVFADGFDADAALAISGDGLDELMVLDLLDSLVRKSLVTVERVGDRVRFDMLEIIRQFAAEKFAKGADDVDVRRRHAEYFATLARRAYDDWRGPDQPRALTWFVAETPNLRIAFDWAAAHDHVETAGRIAAHAAILGWLLQRYEPTSWAEQIVEAAVAARTEELPRVLAAASLCLFTGRATEAAEYDERAREFEMAASFDPFELDVRLTLHGLTKAFNGDLDRWIELAEPLADDEDAGHAALAALLWNLPAVGRHAEAQQIADRVMERVRRNGSPMWIGWGLAGVSRAFAPDDPDRALAASRDAATYARTMRLPFYEALNAREAAVLEASHGDFEQALGLYDAALDSLHRSGAGAHLSIALANLATFISGYDHPDVAATLIGAAMRQSGSVNLDVDVDETTAQLTTVLGPARYSELVRVGTSMTTAEAVSFARERISALRADDGAESPTGG